MVPGAGIPRLLLVQSQGDAHAEKQEGPLSHSAAHRDQLGDFLGHLHHEFPIGQGPHTASGGPQGPGGIFLLRPIGVGAPHWVQARDEQLPSLHGVPRGDLWTPPLRLDGEDGPRPGGHHVGPLPVIDHLRSGVGLVDSHL